MHRKDVKVCLLIFTLLFTFCKSEYVVDVKVQDINGGQSINQADITILKFNNIDLIPFVEIHSTNELGECKISVSSSDLSDYDISLIASKEGYYPHKDDNKTFINKKTNFKKQQILYLSTNKASLEQERKLKTPNYGLSVLIHSLKTEDKLGSFLPKFSAIEIDSLLASGVENDLIKVYQTGEAITIKREEYFYTVAKLWLIESIKMNIDDSNSGGTIFPNLYFVNNNDTLQLNPKTGDFKSLQKEMEQVFDHYEQWWSNPSNLPTDVLLKVDPLEGTQFLWN